jgi:hypothetical protein
MKALLVLLTLSLCSCGIEKPDYKLLTKDDSFELREYPTIKIVSAPMQDMEGRDDSFRKLFRYISGDNADQKKIPMTAPVFMEAGVAKNPEDMAGKMSFMIPAEIVAQGAPAPNEKVLKMAEIGKGTFAVLRFTGWNKAPERDAASSALEKIVKEKKLKSVGKPFFAFYDPPWTPELLRCNEVWQRVEVVNE